MLSQRPVTPLHDETVAGLSTCADVDALITGLESTVHVVFTPMSDVVARLDTTGEAKLLYLDCDSPSENQCWVLCCGSSLSGRGRSAPPSPRSVCAWSATDAEPVASLWPVHIELVTLVVGDYDPALALFVDVLGFDLVDGSPSLTDDGRPERWVVGRAPTRGGDGPAPRPCRRRDAGRGRRRAGGGEGGLLPAGRGLRRRVRTDAGGGRRVRQRPPHGALRPRRGVPRRRGQPLGPARPVDTTTTIACRMRELLEPICLVT